MTILEQLIETLVGAILSSVLPFLQQQANAPTIATEAQNDPDIARRAQAVVSEYDRVAIASSQAPTPLASTPALPVGPVSRTVSSRLPNR